MLSRGRLGLNLKLCLCCNMICSVQNKIPCLFRIVVKDEPSTKRFGQPYRVVALEEVAEGANLNGSIATEKIDGTCCYAQDYNGKPWIWARLDKKLNKAAEKRFREFRKTEFIRKEKDRCCSQQKFEWQFERDFKKTPEEWILAKDVTVKDGNPLPDDNGHIPGWIPLNTNDKSQCWHHAAAILTAGLVLVLRQVKEDSNSLQVSLMPLAELRGKTLELIGTNVNGNPYKLGNKRHPVHFYVLHGDITFVTPPPTTYYEQKDWFTSNPEGAVEGIVWHCQGGTLFKVNRNHLGLNWPIAETRLTKLSVNFALDLVSYGLEASDSQTLSNILHLNGQRFPHLSDVEWNTIDSM